MQISRKVILLLSIVCIIFFGAYLSCSKYLSVQQILVHRAYLLQLTQQHPFSSVLIFIAAYALLVILVIPEAGILTITAGLLFGTWKATVYVTFAAMLGACISFFIVRTYIRSYIEKYYGDHYFKTFNAAFIRHGVLYLLAMRLIPVFPFVIVNILASLTTISFITYFWTAFVGIIPITIIYAMAGEQLQTINSAHDILSGKMLLTVSLLGFFIIGIIFGKKILQKKYRH
jgi:uncharacterized membrane protein YdjX (TVP38/TMEM64 family)